MSVQEPTAHLEVVSPEAWRAAQDALRAREKEHLRASDALAAERRRQPAMEVRADHVFAGPAGPLPFADVFDGRPQLILYSFMFEPGGTPCTGCSFFVDQVPNLAHLHARNTTLALMSPASVEEIEAYRARMGWQRIPWYSLGGARAFYDELGIRGGFALNVFLRDGERILRTYTTGGRGIEAIGTPWQFLDRTPMGRQEDWEDSPPWVPQTPPYEWWRKHDEYDSGTGS